jgi:hypothetical protein
MTEESTEIAISEERNLSTNQASQLLRDIILAARDPAIDGDKVTALANLAMTMQDREAERRFNMAKFEAIMEMPRIAKNGSIINHKTGALQSRYSKFEDMDAVVRPILTKHRLVITFNVNHSGQMVTVQPILSYSDGDMAFVERGGEMVLATDTTGSKNATQGAGSAASYGKRHAMKAMLNIIEDGEDTDGGGKIELPDDKVALIDAGRAKAREGTAAYMQFFDALPKEDKGFLGYAVGPNGKTFHETNKEAARLYD